MRSLSSRLGNLGVKNQETISTSRRKSCSLKKLREQGQKCYSRKYLTQLDTLTSMINSSQLDKSLRTKFLLGKNLNVKKKSWSKCQIKRIKCNFSEISWRDIKTWCLELFKLGEKMLNITSIPWTEWSWDSLIYTNKVFLKLCSNGKRLVIRSIWCNWLLWLRTFKMITKIYRILSKHKRRDKRQWPWGRLTDRLISFRELEIWSIESCWDKDLSNGSIVQSTLFPLKMLQNLVTRFSREESFATTSISSFWRPKLLEESITSKKE